MSNIRVVANGAGAAGIAIIKLLYSYGVRDIIMCDTKGAIFENRSHGMNNVKSEVAKYTNRDQLEGSLADVIKGADVFIGVSVEGTLSKEMVQSMNENPIILLWLILFQKLCRMIPKKLVRRLLNRSI